MQIATTKRNIHLHKDADVSPCRARACTLCHKACTHKPIPVCLSLHDNTHERKREKHLLTLNIVLERFFTPPHQSSSAEDCHARTLAVTDVTVSVSTKNYAVSTKNSAVSTKNSAVNTKNSFKEIFLKILLNFCRYGGLNRAAQLGASYGSVGANCCQQIDDEHQRHVQRRERVSQARLLAAILCRNNSCRAQPQQHRRGDRP